MKTLILTLLALLPNDAYAAKFECVLRVSHYTDTDTSCPSRKFQKSRPRPVKKRPATRVLWQTNFPLPTSALAYLCALDDNESWPTKKKQPRRAPKRLRAPK